MIADSHAHLDMSQFDEDRPEMIQRAHDAGVDLILSIATAAPDQSSVEDTLALAERYDTVWAGLGVSPHDARLADEAFLEKLEIQSHHPKAVLWGEIGLDYYRDLSPHPVQRQVFRSQLRIARQRNLPVSLHCRDAWTDLMEILREEYSGASRGAVLHSFTGTPDQALEAVRFGLCVSFSGMVTFKNAEVLRDAARAIPADRLLVETDCPYLAPVPHRGKRNEPAFVCDTARALALLRNTDYETITCQTSENARRLFGIPPSGAG